SPLRRTLCRESLITPRRRRSQRERRTAARPSPRRVQGGAQERIEVPQEPQPVAVHEGGRVRPRGDPSRPRREASGEEPQAGHRHRPVQGPPEGGPRPGEEAIVTRPPHNGTPDAASALEWSVVSGRSKTMHRILVALDGSPESEKIL